MSATIELPGRARMLTLRHPGWAGEHPPFTARRVYAAAHVAAMANGEIDWESTLAFRDHLWSHGYGVAEAMDTAQRGMGLSWEQARELIEVTASRAARVGGLLACGAGTDQLTSRASQPLAAVIQAYEEQIDAVESAGATVILMASRALAASARGSADYRAVYGHLLNGTRRPVILHWLGDMFDSALEGYWGSARFETAARTVLDIVDAACGAVEGIKLSVLDASKEVWLRRRLPDTVRMYTGDDFNYCELIAGDGERHSDALLGTLAAIAVPAAEAFAALDAGDLGRFRTLMAPTVPLSRKLFEAPTYAYKAGVAFLAWLNGLQPEFAMLEQFETQRSLDHLIEVFELAAAAGALEQPELAVERMQRYLRAGVP